MKTLSSFVSVMEDQEHRIRSLVRDKEIYTEEEYDTVMRLIEHNRPIRDKKLRIIYEALVEGGLINDD